MFTVEKILLSYYLFGWKNSLELLPSGSGKIVAYRRWEVQYEVFDSELIQSTFIKDSSLSRDSQHIVSLRADSVDIHIRWSLLRDSYIVFGWKLIQSTFIKDGLFREILNTVFDWKLIQAWSLTRVYLPREIEPFYSLFIRFFCFSFLISKYHHATNWGFFFFACCSF